LVKRNPFQAWAGLPDVGDVVQRHGGGGHCALLSCNGVPEAMWFDIPIVFSLP
jgi:hypothetical protein